MVNKQKHSLESVFKGEYFEAEVVKGLLESEGIPAMIENKSMSTIFSTYSAFGGPVQVFVNPSDKDIAIELLKTKNDQDS
ncbi:MAG TPA: DUF2007 domain-containing protein [Bacteroidaceae bacterium]|nr:DUF2007 domain-containing protein [Bacteroidaceae bacterium]